MTSWASMLTETAGLRARAARAFKATLLVHAVNSLCAAALVVPVAASVPARALQENHAVGMLYTAVRVFDAFTGSPLRYAGIPAFAMLVVAPFLQIVWLRAQREAAALHEHATRAANVYKQACLVYLLGAAYAALLANCAYLVARGCGLLLSFTHSLRLEQTFGCLLALPFALAALVHAPSLIDRAQLALAQGRTFDRAFFQDVLRAVDLRICTVRAGFVLATAALVLASFAPRLWLGVSPSSSTILFLTAQLAAAARTLTRAVWLAWLCEYAETEAPALDVEPSDEGQVTTAQSRT